MVRILARPADLEVLHTEGHRNADGMQMIDAPEECRRSADQGRRNTGSYPIGCVVGNFLKCAIFAVRQFGWTTNVCCPLLVSTRIRRWAFCGSLCLTMIALP